MAMRVSPKHKEDYAAVQEWVKGADSCRCEQREVE
jgi:hypothetical protein